MQCLVCGKVLKKAGKAHVRTTKHLKVTNDLWDDIEDLKDLIREETNENKKKELNDKLKIVVEKRKSFMDYSYSKELSKY